MAPKAFGCHCPPASTFLHLSCSLAATKQTFVISQTAYIQQTFKQTPKRVHPVLCEQALRTLAKQDDPCLKVAPELTVTTSVV